MRRLAAGCERVTLVVRAENRSHVLARVVLLFHRLNVEIEALCMVRRPGAGTIRFDITSRSTEQVSSASKPTFIRSWK
jgi:hypothetical protein